MLELRFLHKLGKSVNKIGKLWPSNSKINKASNNSVIPIKFQKESATIEVEVGLDPDNPVLETVSKAYLSWIKYNPDAFRATSMPRKYLR